MSTNLRDINRRTSRAAILPFPGDPLLFEYWYGMFKRVWCNEVDTLYVYLNSALEDDAVQYIRDLIAPEVKSGKVVFTYEPHQIEHGEVINRALELVKEEIIMLIEDDCYVWGIGAISQCFNMIECGAYDIVGSKRGSCGFEILEAAQAKWGLDYLGMGDQGPNFWPNLFFAKKELLLRTDRNFGARSWQPGEEIAPLGYTVKELQAGDTFVNTSLQLRALVPENRIHYIPQYHGHPMDLEHYAARQFLFDGKAPWCHIGSLSSGVGGLLKDDQNRRLVERTRVAPGGPTVLENGPTTEMERMEYERRIQWWDMFYWNAHGTFGISEFKRLYKEAIDRVIATFNLNRKRITQRKQAYLALMNGEL
jgi:hypothetical protein